MNNKTKLLIAIESSCDDTAICLYDLDCNEPVAELKASQVDFHGKFGGVVPEIASRQHLVKLPMLYQELQNKLKFTNESIKYIAATAKPGLIGSLLIGCSFANGLAYSLDATAIEIDHLEAHINSIFIDSEQHYPFISMLVSGGHSHFYYVKDRFDYQLILKTSDDACGEAFDKVASLLGLCYPGGPNIEKLARLAKIQYVTGILPLSLSKSNRLELSYSGLKTAVRYYLEKNNYQNDKKLQSYLEFIENESEEKISLAANLAWQFQNQAFSHLLARLKLALKKYKCATIAICGGVSANEYWQKLTADFAAENNLVFIKPKLEYTTDNATMIANLAAMKIKSGEIKKIKYLSASSNSELSNITI